MNAGPSIAGVTPQRTLVPADRVELASIVRDLYAANRTFAFVGGGTDLEYGNVPQPLDAVIRTTALDRVIEYAPEDQTITVEGGMRLAALDAVLAQHDQIFPVDVGDRQNATVGGAIATNAFGPRRHRYGSIKDLIVGVEIVRPDGVVARGGGKVVKNVAGFDLPKLMVGSLGTLGAIVSATVRVFPKPADTRTLLVPAAAGEALLAACLDDPSLDPVAVVHHPALGGVAFTFAGPPAAVDEQAARLADIAAEHGAACDALDGDALGRCAAAESAVRCSGVWRWTTATSIVRASALAPPEATAVAIGYPTLGIVMGSADEHPAIEAFALARDATTVFRAMPQRVRDRIGTWGSPPPSFPLMRALKSNFDPKLRCNPGRFIGGL
jgi:glycolate oxidase FAD binding subunit